MNHAFSASRVAAGVEEERLAVAVADLADGADVGHRDRLSTGHVHRHRHVDVGDVVSAHLVDEGLELVQVDIALERVLRAGVMGLVNDDVVERATGELLMDPRRREVHVAGDVLAGSDEDLRDEVLGPSALVGGADVGEAVALLDRLDEMVEGAGTRIGLIPEHQGAPLPVAHGGRAGVGEQVDVDVVAAQQEGVVPRGSDRGLTLVSARHPDRLDHLDPVRLGNGWHGALSVLDRLRRQVVCRQSAPGTNRCANGPSKSVQTVHRAQ